MSSSLIQAQWSLKQTTGSAITMTMGVLTALNNDNVQALAFLACESFGATLAISADIMHKVEVVAVPSPPPVPIAFLKAAVGFFSNDCATQLGKSQAGIRFLALAAALTPTLSLFNAASAIDIMLRASTPDLRLMPTTRHIKNLLASLEPRCHRVGFANEVLGWRILLQQEALPLVEHRDQSEGQENLVEILLETAPSPMMIDRLVSAFGQVARLGPSTITGVTIRLCTAVPWVIAFTKWCLGAPPRVSFDIQGSEDILPSDSPVTLLIPKGAWDISSTGEAKISIHHSIDHPTQLLAPSIKDAWTGMVSVKSYGQLLLHEFGIESHFQHRMFHEALDCAIPQCLELINFSSFVSEDPPVEFSHNPRKKINKSLAQYRLSPLPSIHKVAATYAKLFDLPRAPDFRTAATSGLVGDYPLVKIYLGELEARCSCDKCSGSPSADVDIFLACECYEFYSNLSKIVAAILVLSLFDSVLDESSSLQLSVPSAVRNADVVGGISGPIQIILEQGLTKDVEISQLLLQARAMVGHDIMIQETDAIMTSGKGQVMYPSLFETKHIGKEGYMALSCVPGILRHGDEEYRKAGAECILKRHSDSRIELDRAPPVLAPVNLYPNLETYWEVTKQDDDHLKCLLGVRSKSHTSIFMQLAPMNVLRGLPDGLLLETCKHNAQAALEQPDQFASYRGMLPKSRDASLPDSHVEVLAVHGADDLRLVACARHRRFPFYVLRGSRACLACCLHLCRMANVQRLIL